MKNARNSRDLPVDVTVPGRVRAPLTGMGVDLSTGERDRVASTDETNRILGYLRQRGITDLADAAEVALGSAMRLGEIARLRWDDRTRRHVLERLGVQGWGQFKAGLFPRGQYAEDVALRNRRWLIAALDIIRLDPARASTPPGNEYERKAGKRVIRQVSEASIATGTN